MIGLFLKERRAWILFFLFLQIWLNGLFFIDSGLSKVSILYVNIMNFLMFFLFILWRYVKETKQLKAICEQPVNRELLSPFQQKYIDHFQKQYERLEESFQQMKIEVLEQQDEVLAWVHEMKSPMTAMKLIVEQVEPYALREKIEKEWIRLFLLLDQKIHETRLSTIEKDNRLEKVCLETVVHQQIKDFRSWCIEKGIGVETKSLDETVTTDAKWLGFIIRQIFSNAVKYSRENSEIHIFTTRDPKGHLLLHIQDFGVGIRAEDLPRIFQRSYTGTIGRETTAATGMGLYLAREAAEKLGLTLKVESQVDVGTTFTIQFPLENQYIQSYGM
ncbi:MAG: sensor histidine kinase [Bacilli bacterium]|jgi:OmpR family two-component system bacitracin resistance sensor histidine kinase BceS|uniref:sensor histidine kinase n=1 Tax=Ureibacillus sp. FSL W7-1570 TaxID=2954593 RepID=UPI001ECD030F|nr:sensor histidine kinase [Bacilli bacterium]